MAAKKSKTFPRWVGITAIVIAVLLALALAFSFITKGGTDLSKFKPKEKAEDAAALTAEIAEKANVDVIGGIHVQE